MKNEFCAEHNIPYCVVCSVKKEKRIEDYLSIAKQIDRNIAMDKLEIERLKIIEQRYEKLRKLNPYQFAELYEAHFMSGKRFDDMVDKL